MYWCGRFLFLLLILLLKHVNGDEKRKSWPHNHNQTLPLFHLYSHDTTLMVSFPSVPALQGLTLGVYNIDKKSHIMDVYDPNDCLPRLFLEYGLYKASNIYPFKYDSFFTPENVTFFDCSSAQSRSYPYYSCPIRAYGAGENVLSDEDLLFCTIKARFPSPIPSEYLLENWLRLEWTQPKTSKPKTSKILRIVLLVTGSIGLVLLLVIVCFYMCRYLKKKGDDQVRLEMFLKDYKALKPTRFTYADIKRITNNFKDKLGEGAHGTVFKGKLSTDIQVAVKLLNHSSDKDDDGQDFINEMGTLGKIHHINVVRLLGFCADGFHRALIYEFFSNGPLQNFISSADDTEKFLGWSKLQQIALAIAKGIEYLHHDCDYRILHFDINPHNMLLDDNFTPKISDFGLAKLCSKDQITVSMTVAKGTLGYIAPEVFSRNFGNVSYKSDIYSYGMLLLEMVGGRKNVNTDQETFQILYPEWIHNLIEGSDTSVNIEDEADTGIVKKLAIVGLWCIQWHSVNRPSIKTVIQMLEGEVDKLKVPPTPFDFNASTNNSIIVPPRRLNLDLDVIHESE